MKRVFPAWLPVVCLLVLAAVPAGLAQGTSGTSTVIQRVLVKVNGEAFTQKDLEEKQIERLQQSGQASLQGDALAKAVTDMMPDLLVTSVDELLLLQRGREAGYHLSNEQFTEMVENIKKDNGMNDQDLTAALKQEGLTLDALRKRLDRSFIVREVQQREVLGHMSLTEQELHQYYDAHPGEFVKPATVTLRELLVAVPVADPKAGPQLFATSTDQAAREKIEALRVRAAGGESFEKLVAEASESASKSNGGLIGPINVSELATGIRDAVEKMQPGDITQPIRSTRGYQLFQLETRTADEPQPFDDVRDHIAQMVGEARLDVETVKYLQQLRAQAYLEWKRDDLRQLYQQRLAEMASTASAQ
jgi:parvulin-like peptidyl-prolyl isomerase